MAGNDHKCDTRGRIANLVALRIRGLLETPLNEYQDPAWVQAAELFAEIVAPCETYSSESLYDLGVDIAKEAEKRGNQATYQAIPGMYNMRAIPDFVSASDDSEVIDYTKTIVLVKVWLSNYEKWFK